MAKKSQSDTHFLISCRDGFISRLLASTLCGADDREEMAALGQNLKEWIGKFVDTTQGIPSAFTLEPVISLIEPTALEKMLRDVANLICNNLTNDIIAIDDKSLRGSTDVANDKRAVHLLAIPAGM